MLESVRINKTFTESVSHFEKGLAPSRYKHISAKQEGDK